MSVLVLAGGTGGHVYPGLAVAERLRRDGHHVAWLGTKNGLESRVVPEAGIALHCVRVSGLRGKGVMRWCLAPFMLAFGFIQSLWIIARMQPRAVLGMGGFVTGPAGVAAWLLGRPLLVHEQNAVPGFTNVQLVRLARDVMESFPGSFGPAVRARHTGNPVRQRIAEIDEPAGRLAGRNGPLRLLVLGGSQGAQILNDTVPPALAQLRGERPCVRHQAGPRNIESARAGYAAAGVDACLLDFIEDMPAAYEWADLVLCRAGATTVAELAAAGVASILVPFPHAVDDHQTCNARYLSEAGAAILMDQQELQPSGLCTLIADLGHARDRLLDMAVAARRLAMPNATATVAQLCVEDAGG